MSKLQREAVSWQGGRAPARSILARVKTLDQIFMLTVLLPTLIAIIYFGFIASDVYVSQSQFVIRGAQQKEASTLGALLKGTSYSQSVDDAYAIEDFVLSRDALRSLDESVDIRRAYGPSRADFFARFPGPFLDKSFERLHLYYQKMVDVQLDPASSIVVLTTRAFDSNDAMRINEKLLEMSEALVNRLNERAKRDTIDFAQAEVDKAEQEDKRATLALARFRNRQGVINPEQQSEISLQQISKLQTELIAAKVQLQQLLRLANASPQIPAVESRIAVLESEVAALGKQVTGGNDSLANKAASYQLLALEKDFADKQLTISLSTLEQARAQAQQQQLYLERIAQPSKPDSALEPKRLRDIFATFVMGLLMWGIVSMLVAGIKEHQS